MSRLSNKTALVIGAGGTRAGWGNGKAAAVLFAREGAHVIAVDVDGEAVEETRAAMPAKGDAATPSSRTPPFPATWHAP